MSDLGCWHQGNGWVVRIRGNEHLMDEDQIREFYMHIHAVLVGGSQQSLGEDYIALKESSKRKKLNQPSQYAAQMEAALGLTRASPQPLRRI